MSPAVYVIAEAGVNHNGNLANAIQLVDMAVLAKADAIKFQTFNPKSLASVFAKKARYQIDNMQSTTDDQLGMLTNLTLTHDEFLTISHYCKEVDIDFLSTPFDIESADFLINELKLNKIKIGSGEITNAPLLHYIASHNVDIILSTGMSLLGDIEQALGILVCGYLGIKPQSERLIIEAYVSQQGQAQLNSKVTLLHCSSAYPAIITDVNLKALKTLALAFPTAIGYSDHTLGMGVSLGAVALGATVIEKHITLDKNMPGPDHKVSMELTELTAFISEIRSLERALGLTYKIPSIDELDNRDLVRKSLVAKCSVGKGESFSSENITAKRPGLGISPMHYWKYLNKVAQQDYVEDVLIDE